MRILLLRLRLLGDIILTTPAVRILRQTHPSAKIDYLAEPEFAEVVDGLKEVDEVILYDRARIRQSVLENLRFLRRMRSRRYDIAIDFHGGPRSAVVTGASGAAIRIGYSGPHGTLFYNRRVPRHLPGRCFHSVAQQLRLLEPLGIPLPRVAAPVTMAAAGPEARARAEAIAGDARASGFDGLAVVHLPPDQPFRDWGLGRVGEVLHGLIERGVRPVLVGGADSMERSRQFVQAAGGAVVSVVGETGVGDLRALIEAGRVFVGVDSGPMHVAATTSTPIVAIFGPNLPRISGPWSARVSIVEEGLTCRPCAQRRCVHGDFRCYGRVTAARILAEVDRWLRDPHVAPAPAELPLNMYDNRF